MVSKVMASGILIDISAKYGWILTQYGSYESSQKSSSAGLSSGSYSGMSSGSYNEMSRGDSVTNQQDISLYEWNLPL